MNFNIDIANFDLSKATTDGFARLETGWYKLSLKEIEDMRPEKNGTGNGANFIFQVVDGECSGQTFKKWFCVQATQTTAKWRQSNFEAYMVRLAQCVGLQSLTSCEQLFGKPFYAFITCNEREYESKEVDREGNFIMKKTTAVDFGKGRIVDNILSCADYEKQNNTSSELTLNAPF